jgi:hypothetical protein
MIHQWPVAISMHRLKQLLDVLGKGHIPNRTTEGSKLRRIMKRAAKFDSQNAPGAEFGPGQTIKRRHNG